jgi:hypothetical protein
MRDLVRHRAQQEALGTRHPLVPHDDQIGLPLLRDIEDCVGGIAFGVGTR